MIKFKNFFFSGISFDINKVKKDNIFFAIKGNKVDGNKFIPCDKGSKIIVSEKKFKNLKMVFCLFIQTI